MIKYHVKFKHQYTVPTVTLNSSSIDSRIIEVDALWEFEDWANVFSFIYAHYNVIGNVTVTAIEQNNTKEETLTLTQEQHDKLKALLLLGFNWIVRTEDNNLIAFNQKPTKKKLKFSSYWFSGDKGTRLISLFSIDLDLPFIYKTEDQPRDIRDLLKLDIKKGE